MTSENNYKIMLDEARFKLNSILNNKKQIQSHAIQILILIGATMAILVSGFEILNLAEIINYENLNKYKESLKIFLKYTQYLHISITAFMFSLVCAITSIIYNKNLKYLTEKIEHGKTSNDTTENFYKKILDKYNQIFEDYNKNVNTSSYALKISVGAYGVGLFTLVLMLIRTAF